MASIAEAKLEQFLQWLQINQVELRGCKIKYCDSDKGFGLFSSNDTPDGVLLVVPLDLAITPMRVMQDPVMGPECQAVFEEGELDDRFLIMVFLTVERLRKNSPWKPYLDMLPTKFGNPLWFTDDELLELKGTTLYKATELQKKKLRSLYDDKVKNLVKKLLILDEDLESEVCFEDFLWANSIFWTRALNIPLPHSYVFPQMQKQDSTLSSSSAVSSTNTDSKDLVKRDDGKRPENDGIGNQAAGVTSSSLQGENVWVEGLVPAIDFCNHAIKAAATWEVDGTGLMTGVPSSMYLLSAEQGPLKVEKEISISYGNKGNEELLYLYGFVIENNPDDYLMVHYPMEALQNILFSDSKLRLLEVQKGEMRCLLPRSLLDQGFFPACAQKESIDRSEASRICNYSWSGQRKTPSYLNRLVFPDDFLVSLRTIAMQENELYQVSALLEELVGSSGEERQPSDADVRAAVWEACGDSGAFQLLVDLLNMKMMDLEEGTGTEECDAKLLEKMDGSAECTSDTDCLVENPLLSRNRWSSIVYRQGQKQLTRLFLKEAEHALQLALSEENSTF